MFEAFLKFVGEPTDEKITDNKAFFDKMQGKTFLNGMYRIFKKEEIHDWTQTVEEAFPDYKGNIMIFAYDWLGRVFALNSKTGTVLLFEPGTGEVLNIPASFEDFHNVEIAEYHEDSLASNFFNEWYEKNNGCRLKHNECAGYKVPLFLNGDDVVDNLEVSDMDVYWTIMAQLIGTLGV